MIQIEIVEWSTGEVVHRFPVNGAKTMDDRILDRAIAGALRNMDRERFGARAVKA